MMDEATMKVCSCRIFDRDHHPDACKRIRLHRDVAVLEKANLGWTDYDELENDRGRSW